MCLDATRSAVQGCIALHFMSVKPHLLPCFCQTPCPSSCLITSSWHSKHTYVINPSCLAQQACLSQNQSAEQSQVWQCLKSPDRCRAPASGQELFAPGPPCCCAGTKNHQSFSSGVLMPSIAAGQPTDLAGSGASKAPAGADMGNSLPLSSPRLAPICFFFIC